MVLDFGSQDVGVGGLVPVTDREQLKPSCGVWSNSVNQFKRRGELAAQAAWNLVHHLCCVQDGKEPELVADLLLSDVSPRHLDDGPPGALH